MIVIPAIDIKGGKCVRLLRGDYSTAAQVADDAEQTARSFREAGARWLHVVDLDGAKDAKPANSELIFRILTAFGGLVEVGGGIRSMETIDFYLSNGISRVILGTAALRDPGLVEAAVQKYGEKIAVGIDAKNGMTAGNGWLETSSVNYIEMAKRMEKMGVTHIVFTDIGRDGTLAGPNLEMLQKLADSVNCHIIASGGVGSLNDIADIAKLHLYGVICGKSLYSGNVDLACAVELCRKESEAATPVKLDSLTDQYFQKSELLPAIVQEYGTGEVLMLAYMNRESFRKTLETGYTWFWSRSRKELWNKGATSGHYQKVVRIVGDCDTDTVLLTVKQTGAACHTGNHSCFFHEIWRDKNE